MHANTQNLLQQYPHRVRYEHPLNERVRIYLRLEYLLKQIEQSIALEEAWQHQVLFRGIFELQELFEQGQIKIDLIKDLERHKMKLNKWIGLNNVNQDMLKDMLDQLNLISDTLLKMPKLESEFKQDRLLSNVRQRMSIPGGCCSFDVPMLHSWLAKQQAEKQHYTYAWWEMLSPINEAITLLLRLTRESGQFAFRAAKGSFFQEETENAEMLRIEIPKEFDMYPVISGSKNRFAIRFTPFDEENSVPEIIDFRIAICS
jgi:cell division protein ZapD